MKNNLRSLAICLCLSFTFSCQTSGPVEPDTTSPIGYNLYVGNWGFTEVYVLDTETNSVVDTLHGFNQGFQVGVWDLAVTRSGAKLYVSTRKGPRNGPGYVYSVDVKSKDVATIFNKPSDVYVAPSGAVFVVASEPYRNWRYVGLIDTLSDAITFIDTLNIRDSGYNSQSLVFDPDDSRFYTFDNQNRLFAYDYEDREIVRKYENFVGDLLHMVISPDGRYLYMAGGPVFDLELDLVVAGVGGNLLGSLALSPDGEYIYITDPGKYWQFEPPSSGKVGIFQTSTNSYIGEIDVGSGRITDRIVVTPDGKRAYVSRWVEDVFALNLHSRLVREVINIYGIFTVPMALGRQQ